MTRWRSDQDPKKQTNKSIVINVVLLSFVYFYMIKSFATVWVLKQNQLRTNDLDDFSSPVCSCTCFRCLRPCWLWWCSSHPPVGCKAAERETSNWTRPTRSVCVSGMPWPVWTTPKTRRHYWSQNLSRDPMRPETRETWTPRTEGQTDRDWRCLQLEFSISVLI